MVLETERLTYGNHPITTIYMKSMFDISTFHCNFLVSLPEEVGQNITNKEKGALFHCEGSFSPLICRVFIMFDFIVLLVNQFSPYSYQTSCATSSNATKNTH